MIYHHRNHRCEDRYYHCGEDRNHHRGEDRDHRHVVLGIIVIIVTSMMI